VQVYAFNKHHNTYTKEQSYFNKKYNYVSFEVFTAETVKVIVFWDAKSDTKDGGSRFLRNDGNYMQGEKTLHPRRQ
jgi:hypothetical protein